MGKPLMLTSKILKSIIYLLFLGMILQCANSARILDEVSPQIPLPADAPDASEPSGTDDVDVAPVVAPANTLPSGQFPATTPITNVAPTTVPSVPDEAAPVLAPSATVAPVADDPDSATAPNTHVAPVVPPATKVPGAAASAATTENVAPATVPVPDEAAPVLAPSATAAPVADDPDSVTAPNTNVAPVVPPATKAPVAAASAATTENANPDHPTLSFFMHDILGGSHPSGRAVTGVVANSDANNLPFNKPNDQIFPINGGIPLNTINGVINDNNYPFLVGLNGSPSNTVLQDSGNNNIVNGGNNQPFVTAGQLPAGITLQQLMFGSVTVVDNEITEGHELGSAVLGKAQGFYLTSSLDGSSHTLVLTALFHGGEHEIEDTISFFGVHRTATPISHITIIGGTGKYENAKGYATIETLPHEDQHTTDGVETITNFTLYLTP